MLETLNQNCPFRYLSTSHQSHIVSHPLRVEELGLITRVDFLDRNVRERSEVPQVEQRTAYKLLQSLLCGL